MTYHAICAECRYLESGSKLAATSYAEKHNETHPDAPCKVVGPTALSMQEFLGWLNCNYRGKEYIRMHEWVIDTHNS